MSRALSSQQAADFLQIHINTLWKLAHKGEIPYCRQVGRSWRFLEEGLVAYMKGEVPSSTGAASEKRPQ